MHVDFEITIISVHITKTLQYIQYIHSIFSDNTLVKNGLANNWQENIQNRQTIYYGVSVSWWSDKVIRERERVYLVQQPDQAEPSTDWVICKTKTTIHYFTTFKKGCDWVSDWLDQTPEQIEDELQHANIKNGTKHLQIFACCCWRNILTLFFIRDM